MSDRVRRTAMAPRPRCLGLVSGSEQRAEASRVTSGAALAKRALPRFSRTSRRTSASSDARPTARTPAGRPPATPRSRRSSRSPGRPRGPGQVALAASPPRPMRRVAPSRTDEAAPTAAAVRSRRGSQLAATAARASYRDPQRPRRRSQPSSPRCRRRPSAGGRSPPTRAPASADRPRPRADAPRGRGHPRRPAARRPRSRSTAGTPQPSRTAPPRARAPRNRSASSRVSTSPAASSSSRVARGAWQPGSREQERLAGPGLADRKTTSACARVLAACVIAGDPWIANLQQDAAVRRAVEQVAPVPTKRTLLGLARPSTASEHLHAPDLSAGSGGAP